MHIKENELPIITIDENSTLEIIRVEENPYARPEIKSLNEPLSKAFGMIEYFTQYDISDISKFTKNFTSIKKIENNSQGINKFFDWNLFKKTKLRKV